MHGCCALLSPPPPTLLPVNNAEVGEQKSDYCQQTLHLSVSFAASRIHSSQVRRYTLSILVFRHPLLAMRKQIKARHTSRLLRILYPSACLPAEQSCNCLSSVQRASLPNAERQRDDNLDNHITTTNSASLHFNDKYVLSLRNVPCQ